MTNLVKKILWSTTALLTIDLFGGIYFTGKPFHEYIMPQSKNYKEAVALTWTTMMTASSFYIYKPDRNTIKEKQPNL